MFDSVVAGALTSNNELLEISKKASELVARIQQKAQENKVEPELRKILEEQGILGKQGWKPAA